MQHFIYRIAYGGIDDTWLDEVQCDSQDDAQRAMRGKHGAWALLSVVAHWECVDAVVSETVKNKQQQGVVADATNKRNEDAVDS